MSKIKAIIFDFDGVIAESMDIKARAFAYLFKDYPDRVAEIVRYHMAHGGLSRFDKFETIHKDILHLPLSEEKKKELGMRFAEYVYREVVKCPLVAGAAEMLEKYYRRLSLFVVSGTPQDEMVSIVEERGLSKYFVGVFGTPEKKNVLNSTILRKYGLDPDEVIFVGDSIDDWQGVKGMGIRFIARIVNEDPFKGLAVEARICDLFDLEKILDGQI